MARGTRRTVEKQIDEISAKIKKKKDEIKALEAKRQELKDAHEAELAAKVVKLATEKGVSIEELVKALEQK